MRHNVGSTQSKPYMSVYEIKLLFILIQLVYLQPWTERAFVIGRGHCYHELFDLCEVKPQKQAGGSQGWRLQHLHNWNTHRHYTLQLVGWSEGLKLFIWGYGEWMGNSLVEALTNMHHRCQALWRTISGTHEIKMELKMSSYKIHTHSNHNISGNLRNCWCPGCQHHTQDTARRYFMNGRKLLIDWTFLSDLSSCGSILELLSI